MQDEITQAIVSALKVKLLPEEKKAIESRSTQDPEAYRLYLLARYHLLQTGAKNLEVGCTSRNARSRSMRAMRAPGP
jgi:adenylate cyclase